MGHFSVEIYAPPGSALSENQHRIVQLLVGRVTVGSSGIAIDLRQDGLTSIIRDMVTPREGAPSRKVETGFRQEGATKRKIAKATA